MEKDTNDKMKWSKWCTVAVIVVVAIFVIVKISNSNTVQDVLEEQKNYELIEQQEVEISKPIAQEEVSKEEVIIAVENIVTKWQVAEMTSEEALVELQKYINVPFKDVVELVNEKLKLITIEVEGEQIFLKAKENYANNLYVEALDLLNQIPKEYSKNDQVDKYQELCVITILKTYSNPYTVEEYEEGISCLLKSIKITDDVRLVKRNEELKEELAILQDVLDIISLATNLYDHEEFEEAFAMLAIGLEQHPGNERLESSLVNFHDHFIIQITKEVKGLCADEEYKEALEIIDEALQEYDCEELHSLRTQVREEKNVLYKIKNDLVEKTKFYAHELSSEEFDVKQAASNAGAYIMRSGEKLMLGEYSKEDITVLALTGNVVASLAGVDFIFDLRDVTYDLVHWGEEEYFMINLAADVIALVPAIGMIKYLDHYKDAIVGLKSSSDIVDSVADVGKNTDASVDAVDAMIDSAKSVDKVIDIADDIKDAAKTSEQARVIARNAARGYTYVKTLNAKLLGKTHPETGVEFVLRKLKYSSDELIQGVFPVFKSYSDVNLPKKLYKESFDQQKAYCLEALQKQVKNPLSSAKKNFTEEQLDDISQGILPEGFTWHHNEREGLMQLVDTEIHNATNHTGGMSLWGIGYD